jgi:T5SS/PEP-CTERM-associated repeat protein
MPAEAAIVTVGNVTPAPPAGGGNVAGNLQVGDTSYGNVQVASVALNITGVGNSVTLGQSAGGIGVINLTAFGAMLGSANDVNVGNAGSGSIVAANQSQVMVNDDLLIGIADGSTGSVFLDGLGTTGSIGDTVAVGQAGSGLMQITNGARLTADDAIVGQSASGDGTVTVSGSGSLWRQGNSMTVGDSGRGVFQVLSQGRVETTNTVLGNSASGNGTINITGVGSAWDTTGFLNIGTSGQGVLNVADGGRHTVSGAARIATAATGDGRVAVSGASSLWSVATTLTIGESGYGSLRVTSGGRVNSGNSIVGDNTGSRGDVLVDGVNSSWAIAGTLTVSDPGESVLSISNGGVVSATGAIKVGAAGELILAGGRLQTSSASGVTNQGLILGGGRILAPVTNSASGNIRTQSTDSLVLGSTLANIGLVDLQGGELEVLGAATNSSAIDARSAVMRFDAGLTNSSVAQLAITSGAVDVYGVVTNAVGGQIVVGDRAEAVFHDALTNNGQLFVMPGGNALTLGNLSLSSAALVSLDISSEDADTGFGQVQAGGSATLAGALRVTLSDGFTPSLGDSFQVITAADGLTGAFATQMLPALTPGLQWTIDYSASALTLTVIAGLPADFNQDGTVNGADLAAWKGGFGTTSGAAKANGDADGDGDVDGADFLLWQQERGLVQASAQASAVPEPAAILLALAAAALVLPRRQKFAFSS